MLTALPYEIVIAIADWLSPTDLRAFSRVCSKIYSYLLPLSYRAVQFHAANEWALNILNTDSFFRAHQQSDDNFHLSRIRDLTFSAPFQIARFNRCIYHSPYQPGSWFTRCTTLGPSDEIKAHSQFLDDISRQVEQVIRCLGKDKLKSFRWHLGLCIPPGLFDTNGLLVNQQEKLESLSLITDGSCPHAGDAINGLSRLNRLKSLSWEGLQQAREFESLHRCIRGNCESLVSLSVRFAVSFVNFDIIESLKYESGSTQSRKLFPRLLHLSLSKALLQQRLEPAVSLNLGKLHSLSLRNCRNDLQFLESLSQSSERIQIQRFEFCSDILLYHCPLVEDHALAAFLRSFTGLRHLQLRLSNFTGKDDLEDAISRHRSSLKTLVHHERELQNIDAEGLFQETRDRKLAWCPRLFRVLDLSQICALALCVSPFVLRSSLEPLSRDIPLKVLHLRWSGMERIHRNIRQSFLSRLSPGLSYAFDDSQEQLWPPHTMEQHNSEPELDLSSDISNGINEDEGSLAELSEEDEYLGFAEWAFGPTGIRNLKILAIGDFSFRNRYFNQQILLWRSSKVPVRTAHSLHPIHCENFRVASVDDYSFREDISGEEFDFLGACPEESLMDSPFE